MSLDRGSLVAARLSMELLEVFFVARRVISTTRSSRETENSRAHWRACSSRVRRFQIMNEHVSSYRKLVDKTRRRKKGCKGQLEWKSIKQTVTQITRRLARAHNLIDKASFVFWDLFASEWEWTRRDTRQRVNWFISIKTNDREPRFPPIRLSPSATRKSQSLQWAALSH